MDYIILDSLGHSVGCMDYRNMKVEKPVVDTEIGPNTPFLVLGAFSRVASKEGLSRQNFHLDL